MAGFEVLEHTADVGFAAHGAALEDVFVQAVAAMLAIAVETGSIQPREARVVTVSGDNVEALLVNLLDEVLFLFDANIFAPCGCSIRQLGPHTAEICLQGEPRDPGRHPWRVIVKAVTYHGLSVRNEGDEWHARVFLDV